jgi:pantoate--beta-alanine ligase
VEVIRTAAATLAACEEARARGDDVGLVPTMGALHEGHASLVRRARAERAFVVVSVFVNPLQFHDPIDLAAYPRDEDHDLSLLRKLDPDLVFGPGVDEMYPDGEPEVTIDPGPLGDRLEGASRPGHFGAVATVVAKLFHAVGRCAAYFGEKDAQQLAVIRRAVADLDLAVQIVGCPTVREADGLAMSSRNSYLGAEERRAATVLHRALQAARARWAAGERDAERLRAVLREEIAGEPRARLDYAAVADPLTFQDLARVEGEALLLLAVFVGRTRLIDNMRLA